MTTHEFIANLEAKYCAYTSLCVLRDRLHRHVPSDDRAMAAEWIELQAMASPALPGVPHLDASIMLLLQEIAVYMEYVAADLEANTSARSSA